MCASVMIEPHTAAHLIGQLCCQRCYQHVQVQKRQLHIWRLEGSCWCSVKYMQIGGMGKLCIRRGRFHFPTLTAANSAGCWGLSGLPNVKGLALRRDQGHHMGAFGHLVLCSGFCRFWLWFASFGVIGLVVTQ
jgi:hypothetical protein